MSIDDRLADAELLWQHGHREGALLSALVAVAATARRAHPDIHSDAAAFRRFLRSKHDWTISVEYRTKQTDLDQLFYKWLRCELVHQASLPVDLRVDDQFADPNSLTVKAGGPPDHVLLLTPAWFHFLTHSVRETLAADPE